MPRASLWVAIFLLITSGMSLPLVSSASSPVQLQAGMQTLATFREGHMILDGVPSKFIVSGVYVVPPHSFAADRPPGGPCPSMRPADRMVLIGVDGASNACMMPKVQTDAYVTGFLQGSTNGCFLKLGLGMGEMVITPLAFSMVSSVTPNVPRVWWDFFQRRSKFEIYVEILELIKRAPMTPFEVAFYARLNHKRTKEYVEFLLRSGYLHPVIEDGKTVFVLTKEGMEFLDRVKALFVGTRFIEVKNYSYQRDF